MDIIKLVDYMGFFGPVILFISSIGLYWTKPTIRFWYIIGSVVNNIINHIVKIMVAQPRPSEDVNIFNAKKTHTYERLGAQQYGMPSGHAQMCAFSTVYLFLSLSLENTYIVLLFLIMSIGTMIQRVKYKNHTSTQVIVGFIVGSATAVCFYHIMQHSIKENIQEKSDIHSIG